MMVAMGIFDRWRMPTDPGQSPPPLDRATPEPGPEPEPQLSPEDIEDLKDWVDELARPGLVDEEDVRVRVGDVVADHETWGALTEEQVTRAIDEVYAHIRARQAQWPDEGDAPALARAFAAMEQAGILARMNFTCCNTCGHAEIADEDGADIGRGYVFFHEQDTSRLQPGRSELFLSFGAFERPGLVDRSAGQDAVRAALTDLDCGIAAEAVEILRTEGLDVDWTGESTARILVTVDWRRKLPATAE